MSLCSQDIWLIRSEFWLRKALTYPQVYSAAKVEVCHAPLSTLPPSTPSNAFADVRRVCTRSPFVSCHAMCRAGARRLQESDESDRLDLSRCCLRRHLWYGWSHRTGNGSHPATNPIPIAVLCCAVLIPSVPRPPSCPSRAVVRTGLQCYGAFCIGEIAGGRDLLGYDVKTALAMDALKAKH
jgi:hypothetical protein